MPTHQTVAKYGDAAQQLINAVGTHSRATVSDICRMMAADIASHVKAFLPGVEVPDEVKKAASLRRQWYRWSVGLHVPDVDDLGCLLRVARRAGWLPPRGQVLPDVPRNVQALVAEVEAAEDERRTLEIEAALETNRLDLESIARQLASISRRMPGGVHDIGAVVHALCVKVIDEVSPGYPLGTGAPALRSAGKAMELQWSLFAESVEAEERSVLALEQVLVDLENDESLLREFEERAGKRGLWPEDLNILWRWVKLGPSLLGPRSPAVDQVKLRQFLELLSTFDGQSRRRFDLRRLKLRPTRSRAGKGKGRK